MSSILGQVNSGSRQEGLRIVIAGQEKMGKTTIACGAPSPLLVPLEIGYAAMSVSKTPMLQTFTEVLQLMDEILASAYNGTFTHKTIVFDSVTALERQIHTEVLKTDPNYGTGNKKAVTMESGLGGYGRAYSFANEKFTTFLNKCDILAVYYGINIVLTSHVFASTIVDPNSGAYDSWDILLHSPKNQKTYGKRELITQWADLVGFLYEPIYVSKGESITKGVSANKGRVMGLSRTPSYTAGNRFGAEGEIAIPKVGGWNYLAQSIYQNSGINVFTQ